MPTKNGFHAFHINLYMHEFFEPILFFNPHGPKGNFGHFLRQAKRSHNFNTGERQAKRSHNSDTGEAMPTKIVLHAFYVNLYLHEFIEPIPFFDPHGL